MPGTLAEQYPEEYAAWMAAGGDPEEAFRFYLMGEGKLPVDKTLLMAMADNMASHMKELQLGIDALPLA